MAAPAAGTTEPAVNRWMRTGLILFFFGAATLLMTGNFTDNFMKVGPPGKFETFEDAGTITIESTMRNAAQHGIFANHGLVFNHTGKEVYTSQSGMHRTIYSILYAIFGGGNIEGFFGTLRWWLSFLLALGIAYFAYAIGKEFGWVASALIVWFTLNSDWLIFSGRNLYDVMALQIAPFFVSWWLYPKVLSGRIKLRTFLIAVGALVFLKAGSGYEYVTNNIMAATVAPVYFGVRDGKGWKFLGRHLALIFAAAVAGMALAMCVHFIQVSAHLGSPAKGWQAIMQKAAARTYGGESNFEGSLGNDAAPPGVTTFQILHAYMTVKATSLPFNGGEQRIWLTFFTYFAASILVLFMALADGRLFPVFGERRRKLLALSAATFFSLAGTMTWPVLAKGHMFHHIHLNGLVFFNTYMLTLYGAIGALVALMLRQLGRYVTGGLPKGELTPPE